MNKNNFEYKNNSKNKKRKNRNYFASKCIENFGVVPLFLFFALRSAPFLLSLRTLLLNVALVLETIGHYSCTKSILNKINKQFEFLSLSTHFVKNFLAVSTVLFSFLVICADNASATEIVLTPGAYHEIFAPDLENYAVGDTTLLGHKYLSSKKLLVLKAKKIGNLEIKIWNKNKSQNTYKVSIIQKNISTTLLSVVQTLNGAGVNANLQNSLITVSGDINTYEKYQLIVKLYKTHQEKILVKASLTQKLKNDLIGEIYQKMFSEFIDTINCTNTSLLFECTYAETPIPSNDLLQNLKDKFLISFIPTKKQNGNNYKITLKIVQIEKSDGTEFSFGLDSLNISLSDVLAKSFTSLKDNKMISAQKENVEISTLASPESIVQLNNQTEISLGSEVPYTSKDNDVVWKFAGLNVKITISQHGDKFIADFYNELTRPDENGAVGGSKNVSKAQISLDQPIQLFEVGIKINGTLTKGIPVLSSIPFLGKLFESKNNRDSFKKITGVLILTEVD